MAYKLLDARVLAAVYRRRAAASNNGDLPHPREVAQWREDARDVLFHTWEEALESPNSSRELVAAIRPVLRSWVECPGAPNYHLTQVLTGHGCFGEYLFGVVRREPTAECHHCAGGMVDTARHTREECPAWAVPRAALSAVIGPDLSLPAMIVAMVGSEAAWRAVATFSDAVMSEKEAAERERENSADSLPMRRRRPGRRRQAHLVNIDRAPP
ncbi:uncharacterized protein LOC126376954 [Pectinophora gossypiella]|uniref:uncharacterized protein LOC126376954 n=1 Tax=Pectinophora gossypiella TaxID=13191 RepID=UPI00214DFB1D|nr:uncharacterized protein LOC126376954 [Pectinophora gossypiella]